MTFGNSETYLNTSVPILDIYNRQKFSGSDENLTAKIYNPQQLPELSDNIFSADIQEITSQNTQRVLNKQLYWHTNNKRTQNRLIQNSSDFRLQNLN